MEVAKRMLGIKWMLKDGQLRNLRTCLHHKRGGGVEQKSWLIYITTHTFKLFLRGLNRLAESFVENQGWKYAYTT